jgi:flavin-dependent dehydrogenase
MGIVGTVPARDRTLLVGDAAGLVNPLQGEGIAAALMSGRAAAEAVLADPGCAAGRYRRFLTATHGSYASVAAPLHAASISGSPKRVSAIGRTLTLPGLSRVIAAPWALYWNDLRDGAPLGLTTAAATAAHRVGRLATARSRTRRRLENDLADS